MNPRTPLIYSSSAAFVAGGDSYVVQGNGVAGSQDTDVLVVLAGIEVTSLGGILSILI